MHSPSPSQTHRQDDPQKQSTNARNEEDSNNAPCSQVDNSKSREKQCCGSSSERQIDRTMRFSQWDEKVGLLNVLHSKRAPEMYKFDLICSTSYGGSIIDDGCCDQSSEVPNICSHQGDSYQLHRSIPDQISFPATNPSNIISTSTSVVTPIREILPIPEAVVRRMNAGISAEAHLALSNILGHVHSIVSRFALSSNSGTQMQSSFSWLFHHCLSPTRVPSGLPNVSRGPPSTTIGYTSRTRITSQRDQAPSISLGDVASRNEVNFPRQQYVQSVLFMHMLDGRSFPGSFSLRITNAGSGRQDIIILGDSSFFDVSDFRDHHEDMRLDVDNMSYEELLDLEDRIGNVSTGLSEEVVDKFLKHRKYFLFSEENALKESCIICQEDYVEEDELGALNCAHDFHTICIKQWLKCKNICPICKSVGLSTSDPDIPTYS